MQRRISENDDLIIHVRGRCGIAAYNEAGISFASSQTTSQISHLYTSLNIEIQSEGNYLIGLDALLQKRVTNSLKEKGENADFKLKAPRRKHHGGLTVAQPRFWR